MLKICETNFGSQRIRLENVESDPETIMELCKDQTFQSEEHVMEYLNNNNAKVEKVSLVVRAY